MRRRSPFALGRFVERMARLSPPHHRDLVRGMAAELESIADPEERTRFALGAIAATARLTLGAYIRAALRGPGRFVGVAEVEESPNHGGPLMSMPTTRELLRRHLAPFAIALTSLTALLLAAHAFGAVPRMMERGFSAGAIAEALLLAVPFTTALTIPMAVFLAVLWVFLRLGDEGVLASARRERHGIRRLVLPVLGVAAIFSGLTFVSNAQVVPRSNARLTAVVTGQTQAQPQPRSDREMTLGELWAAARTARAAPGGDTSARAAFFETEIQKKLAVPAACVILALVGMATAIRFPRGGVGLFLGASVVVFTGYFVALVAGEQLADRQAVSPLVAMWMANACLLAIAVVLAWGPSRVDPGDHVETLAIGG